MKKTNLIYYPGGCYGTFIEWSCNFFNADNSNTQFPFQETGSSHNYIGNFLFPSELDNYLKSDQQLMFCRTHPAIFQKENSYDQFHNKSKYDLIHDDLSFLSQNFEKILVCHPGDNVLWTENNGIEKIYITEEMFEVRLKPLGFTKEFMRSFMTEDLLLKYRFAIDDELSESNISAWGKNSIFDFDVWEVRELLSLYWFNRQPDYYTCWDQLQQDFPNIKFISIGDLRNNFCSTIINYLRYFNADINNDKIKEYLDLLNNEWYAKQKHINKDSVVKKIISCLKQNEFFDWASTPLTILDEAYIQKSLADSGIQIKCYNVNKFPTNTKDFQPLLEKDY